MSASIELLEEIIGDLRISRNAEQDEHVHDDAPEGDCVAVETLSTPPSHKIDQMDVPFVRKARNLNIYDFDGTLFRSPEPSPSLWDRKSMGRILGQPCEGGYGWYQDTLTLSESVLSRSGQPIDTLWNESLVEHVRASSSNEHDVTVLLTGRSTQYVDVIEALIEQAGLPVFDHMFLKPVSLEPGTAPVRTMEFKLNVIRTLVLQYHPDHTQLFDDRLRHVDRFVQFGQELVGRCTFDVELVKLDVFHLPSSLELEVVQTLVDKYSPPTASRSIKLSVSYTGVILDGDAHEAILEAFSVPEGWSVKAHHMTMCLGPVDASLEAFASSPAESYALGREAVLKVVGVGVSDTAMALLVESDVPSKNAIKHITVAVSPEGKPKDSNSISDWTRFEATDLRALTLSGVISERVVHSIEVPKRAPKTSSSSHRKATLKLNYGPMIREAHPEVLGPQIGKAVKLIKQWEKERRANEEEITKEMVEQFIAELCLDSL